MSQSYYSYYKRHTVEKRSYCKHFFIKKRLQYSCFPMNIANFKNTYLKEHLRTAASVNTDSK